MSIHASLPVPRRRRSSRASRSQPIAAATPRATSLPILYTFYDALFRIHGPQHWWPGRSRFEVIVGAILTQNTSWTNVELAIRNLRHAGLLTPGAIERVDQDALALLIRSSGYFRQKARKLKEFVAFLRRNYEGSLTRMFRTPTETLRGQLLAVHGIGPETADSILLYAGEHRVFVVDAYTRRMLERHGLVDARAGYEQIRALFETSLAGADSSLFNEYHALIVHTGKRFCRTREPLCSECPLGGFLPAAGLTAGAEVM
jgi:endonuclease III related protein